jgi:putative inorganic carbon (hco3(-)) transporter
LPIRIDVHFYYTPAFFVRDIDGLRVNAFDVFFFLALGAWLFRTINDHRQTIRFFPRISLPFLAIWLLSLAGLLRAGVDGQIVIAVLWTVFKVLLVFIYVANNLRRLGRLENVLAMLLIIGTVQALIGLAQYASGGKLGLELLGESERSFFEMKAGADFVSRVAGTLGHPNKLAVLLGTLIPLNIALVFGAESRTSRGLMMIPLTVMATAMVLTYSRGGWLGLAAGGGITLWWCMYRRLRHRTLAAIILVAVSSALLLASLSGIPSVRKRLFEDDYGTAALRGPMSQVALNVIANNPLLGVGLNHYTAVSNQYDLSTAGVSYAFPRPVHNEFLLIGAEQGIPALILFLVILAQMLIYLYRIVTSPRTPRLASYAALGFFGGWIGWVLHHQFEYAYCFFSETTWVMFGLFQALYWDWGSRQASETERDYPTLIRKCPSDHDTDLPEAS